MNRFISWHSMPNLKAWTLLASFFIQLGCNSATEFTAIEKRETSLDATAGNFQRTFAAAEIRKSTVKWTPEDNKIVETVDVQKSAGLSLTYNQVDRPMHEINATQGYDGRDNAEQFSLWQAGQLDLLIVMDNSGTMQPYQEQVAARLDPLLENIKNTNWRIAVVTTDSPCVRGVISRGDYDANKSAAEAAFQAAVRAGTNGSNTERGVEMAIKGFDPVANCVPGPSQAAPTKWTRADARTAVIIVTDEANCGSSLNDPNEGCPSATHPEFSYFGPEDFMRLAPSETKMYGLLYDKNVCEDNGYDKQPDDYFALAKPKAQGGTGGLWRPICLQDYTEVLGEISRDIGDTMVREFELAATPTGNSLRVYFDGTEATSGFSVDGKKVTLVGSVAAATKVEFKYSHGAKDRFQSVALAGSLDPKSIKVMIDGNQLPNGEYVFDPHSGAVEFARMPADYAKIYVSYREPGNLEREFVAPADVLSESLEVMVNGEKASGFSFDEVSGKIAFESAPNDGAEIKIRGRRISDYVLAYHLNSGDMTGLASVTVVDAESGDGVDGVIESGNLTLPVDVAERTSKVAVVFSLKPDPDSFMISLPEVPVAESVSINASKEAKECLAHAPRDGRTINADCLIGQSDPVEINFDYVVRRITEFTVEPPKGKKYAEWSVYVDGQSVPFAREKDTFTVDAKLLKATSVVTIEGRPKEAAVAQAD